MPSGSGPMICSMPTPASDTPKLPDVVARCIRVAVRIGVGVTIAESWVVQVFALANESEWDQNNRSSRTAGVTLFRRARARP